MENKSAITECEREAKISFLRKQRDGLVIGEYRSILAGILGKILMISSISNNSCSFGQLKVACNSISPHAYNVLANYCMDLVQLGYIQISDNDVITPLKELDF